MKTFRFTVPEPRLSAVEKRNHHEEKTDSDIILGYLNKENELTEGGQFYIAHYETNRLSQFSSFRRMFLRQKIVEGFLNSGITYLILASFTSLIAASLAPFVKMTPIIPTYLGISTMVAFWSARKSFEEERSLYSRLKACG